MRRQRRDTDAEVINKDEERPAGSPSQPTSGSWEESHAFWRTVALQLRLFAP